MFSKFKIPKIKINTTALGIVILVIIFSALNLKSNPKVLNPVSNTPVQPIILTGTPVPDAQSQQLEVLRFYPSEKTPSIANTNLTVSFTFNRRLTRQEMENMTLQVNGLARPALVFDTNYKIVYVRPGENWRNNYSYTITLKISDPLATFTHTFTPNSKPPTRVIIYPDTHPITPSPAL